MNETANASDASRDAHTAGGSGPVVVIAIGLVVVAAAVILALTVNTRPAPAPGEGDGAAEPAPATSSDAANTNPVPGGNSPEPAPLAAAAGAEQKKDAKKSDKAPAKAAAKQPAEELEQLPLDLPNPVFAGTPTEVPKDVTIDRKRLGKRRPPFMAPKGLANVGLEKKVTSSDANPIIGDLEMVTDGDKEALDGRMVELAPGKQHVTIDLGAAQEIFAIVFWHNHMEARVYRDVVVQVSNDPDFVEATVVYNNDRDNSLGMGVGENFEYFESDEGELAPVPGVKGRYVRLWSKGSTADDQNHYSEVEVWARPVK